jgi:hypothetical protein
MCKTRIEESSRPFTSLIASFAVCLFRAFLKIQFVSHKDTKNTKIKITKNLHKLFFIHELTQVSTNYLFVIILYRSTLYRSTKSKPYRANPLFVSVVETQCIASLQSEFVIRGQLRSYHSCYSVRLNNHCAYESPTEIVLCC